MESPGREANNFAAILESRAATEGARRVYLFLRDGETEDAALTFAQLYDQARNVAGHLHEHCKPGDRVVLLYPAGLAFVVAFFGCLLAGVVPVAVTVPNRRRGLEIVRAIALDSGARCALSSKELISKFANGVASDPSLQLRWFDTERWSIDFRPLATRARCEPNDVALLQYTSGSTGSPRGVIVTHGNLFDNHTLLHKSFGHDRSSIIASWLPMFHDMGLGTMLQAVWVGIPCVLMSPTAFLQKPVRWLRAISRYRATLSGGPDFAYDLCVRRIAADECAGLDLSSWRGAFNGSEPVRTSTLNRFAETFGRFGFRRSAFYPVYGLAEATLFVSGGQPHHEPIVRRFSREGLERGEAFEDSSAQAKELVGCGSGWLETRIHIVNPDTLHKCAPRQIGEIWVASPSVAAGYWQKPEETREIFQAETTDGDGPFLRTGDLGFQSDGQLFVTGRYKDLIIIRGRNHYPQDIEASVSQAHAALEPLAAAAFSVETEDGEQLVIVQEVRRSAVHRLEAEPIFRAIRNVVADHHGVNTHAIVLVAPGGLLRTTSGKVRRKACRKAFLEHSLQVLGASVFGSESVEAVAEPRWSILGREPVIAKAAGAEGREDLPGAQRASGKAADTVIEWLRGYARGAHEPSGSDVLRTLDEPQLLDLARQGLLGMQVGRQHGGLGLGHSDTARVLEQVAAIDLNAGLFLGLHNYLGVGPLMRHATPKTRETILPRLAQQGELAAFAFAEPNSGVSAAGLTAYAEPINGSGWRLFGRKYASGTARRLGVINVFVRHSDREGMTGFVVPLDTPGLTCTEEPSPGGHGLARSRVALDGVALGHEAVLGRPGAGMRIAFDAMAHARFATAAACLGGMKRCAQLVFHYSARRQTGARLMAHPVTLAKLGRVTAGIAALEALVQRIAQAVDSGGVIAPEAFTVCKIVAPEMLWQAVDDLVQLLGRRGYVETPHVRHLVRDAQALRSCEGPSEVVSSVLGARLLEAEGEEAIQGLAANVLAAPNAARLVAQAAEAGRARAKKATSPDTMFWTHLRTGELATWLMLFAAVEGRRHTESSGDLERAFAWCQANVDRTLALLDSNSPLEAEDVEITKSIAAYSRAIGDSDPLLTWRHQTLPPLLQLARGDGSEPPSSSRSAVLGTARPAMASPSHAANELQAWIVTWLAGRLRVAESQIDPTRAFADHGVDSLAAVELAKALSDHLGRSLDETLLWNFANIQAVVQFLTRSESGAPGPATKASRGAETATQAELEAAIDELEKELQRRS